MMNSQAQPHISGEPAWVRNEHSEDCGCGWCSPGEHDTYYVTGYLSLPLSMSYDEALALLHEIQATSDRRITASLVLSCQADAGARYKLLLELKGQATWRRLFCRCPAEWYGIQRMWEGL